MEIVGGTPYKAFLAALGVAIAVPSVTEVRL
jgi:hypothetical protein